jgi:hypothetical protein
LLIDYILQFFIAESEPSEYAFLMQFATESAKSTISWGISISALSSVLSFSEGVFALIMESATACAIESARARSSALRSSAFS